VRLERLLLQQLREPTVDRIGERQRGGYQLTDRRRVRGRREARCEDEGCDPVGSLGGRLQRVEGAERVAGEDGALDLATSGSGTSLRRSRPSRGVWPHPASSPAPSSVD
jgi:hypothetical protein